MNSQSPEVVDVDVEAGFGQFGLPAPIENTLVRLGYTTPTPIQEKTIALMMQGNDILGQAQTGTGKTAAFALPVLANLDSSQTVPQVLVLTPTRELAIQVADAFSRYASSMQGVRIVPIYGGQDYRVQTRALERGANIIVGTPGRVMDHMRRGKLNLSGLKTLVLDEADEMLRMGFIDDVEWVLENIPAQRQFALFSATMPDKVRKIASKHLNNPQHIAIKQTTATASTIEQRVCTVTHTAKFDALCRILETEERDGMIVFVRTRQASIEVAEKLEGIGHTAAALNGDLQQKQREHTINRLKQGKLDVLVATDVAARGLDVDRITHVLNYDSPHDTEAYIHRIGRTGRAGRTGIAILFMTPRERHLKNLIERATKSKLQDMQLPTDHNINQQRLQRFKDKLSGVLQTTDLATLEAIMTSVQEETGESPVRVAAATAKLLQNHSPSLFPVVSRPRKERSRENREQGNRDRHQQGSHQQGRPQQHKDNRNGEFAASHKNDFNTQDSRPAPSRQMHTKPESGMERYRLAVGSEHDVSPRNIVGAIANEAGIENRYIGRIEVNRDHSFIDLPEGMPKEIFMDLKKTRVCGRPLKITRQGDDREQTASSKKPGGFSDKNSSSPKSPQKGKPPSLHSSNHPGNHSGNHAGKKKKKALLVEAESPKKSKNKKKTKVRKQKRKDKGKPGSHRKKNAEQRSSASA